MDADRIDQLKAGREMDALVAVEVMGMKHENNAWWNEDGVRVALPRYSTSRNEGLMVERYVVCKLGLRLDCYESLKDSHELNNLPNEEWYVAYAKATPEQRCRAALKAVMKRSSHPCRLILGQKESNNSKEIRLVRGFRNIRTLLKNQNALSDGPLKVKQARAGEAIGEA
ncbi:MAG: hypothetical protein ABSC17_02310 [Thermacetogeniaceae bacterium]